MIKGGELNRRQLILVVDDQEINRDVLGMILEDDYEIMYAEDGVEALEKIEHNKVDIITSQLVSVMIERERGKRLIKSINGCYYNVVGLPVARTLEMLDSLQVKV